MRRILATITLLSIAACADPVAPPVRTPVAPDAALASSAASAYTGQDIGTLSGGSTAFATAINDNGDVTGASASSLGNRAFLYSGSVMQNLNFDGVPNGINNAKEIAAACWNGVAYLACAWTPALGVTLFTIPGATSGESRAVNTAGMHAGYWLNGSGVIHAFRWTRAGGFVDAQPPGAYIGSVANDINDKGQMAGWVYLASGQIHAFLWNANASTGTDLGNVGGSSVTLGVSLNNAGAVVGQNILATGANAAVYKTPTSVLKVIPQWGPGYANDVSTLGRAVGISGTVVGAQGGQAGTMRTAPPIDLLPYTAGSYASSEATGVNKCGMIAGFVSGPSGSNVVRAVIWKKAVCD